ncbi:hypothetical protein [Undibacterium rugosum]|uniref:Uncharacterized protein n=1 Tax=Undibacterium rugosum TaxID=2762291 RepID=A0A923I4B7_9BURK|nr:hypothetical protein [Undibacterium rugosum]MBC3936297.1 hypothetical protein [Undibacterium rugosum]MBR7777411.1 hypothetical protein [Undibacterium rugosum]
MNTANDTSNANHANHANSNKDDASNPVLAFCLNLGATLRYFWQSYVIRVAATSWKRCLAACFLALLLGAMLGLPGLAFIMVLTTLLVKCIVPQAVTAAEVIEQDGRE